MSGIGDVWKSNQYCQFFDKPAYSKVGIQFLANTIQSIFNRLNSFAKNESSPFEDADLSKYTPNRRKRRFGVYF
jgi:hypothetical protein